MYLIKVALPGFDVTEATPEQCAIHSAFNSPKIDAMKDHFITLHVVFLSEPPHTVGGVRETIFFQVPHEYGYIPQLWVHNEYSLTIGSTTKRFGPGEALLAIGTVADGAYVGMRADRNFVYGYIRKHVDALGANPAVVGKSVTLRAYIFADTAFV